MSDILYTFRLIENFCFSKRITKNCIAITLTVILMFSKHRLNSIKLASLIMLLTILQNCLDLLFEKQYFASLFKYLSQYITLSCCEKNIALLLCSRVFKSDILYNLIEAYLFEIEKTLKSIVYNSRIFACLITVRNSIISAL